MTISFPRYESQPWSPSLLYTMCRQDQERQEELYREVVMASYTGLGVAKNFRVKEASKSGLTHSHGLGWRKEVEQGPDSMSSLLGRLQEGAGDLTREEQGRVVELGRGAITVTTSATDLARQFPDFTPQEAEDVVALARRHQVHTCTHHCSGSSHPGQQCSQYFPRPPSLLSLLAMRPPLLTDEQKARLKSLEKIAESVRQLLHGLPDRLQPDQEDDDVASLLSLLHQVADLPVLLLEGGFFWAGVVFPPSQELDYLLQKFSHLAIPQEDTVLLGVYHCSLLTRRHAKYLPVRSVRECWGVNYNPWLLRKAKSNIEVELVTHTPQALYSYLTKGVTSQTVLMMAEEVESRGGGRMADMADQLRLAVDEGWREVCLTQAFHLLDPGLHLSTSNWSVVKVCVEPFSAIVRLYSIR